MTIAGHHSMTSSAKKYWGLCFTAEEAGCEVNMASTGTPPTIMLETSTDGKNWSSFNPDGTTPVTLDEVGDCIYFRAGESGNVRISTDSSNYRSFTLSKKCAASGNIMSILDRNGYQNLEIQSNYAFCSLFYNCTNLTAAPQLPATTLASNCYMNMFQGCTSLIVAPKLSATTLANYCYGSMFRDCTSLTNAPTLPATTLTMFGYQYMFFGCSSLTAAPALPATTLADYCYEGMFNGCTSLTTAPVLSAMTLATSCCNGMFSGCSSLTAVSSLPATTLANYCYQHMFEGCTSLTTAPALPATMLASGCYQNMFQNCSSLTTAPALPATAIKSSCYSSMFSSCTSLTAAPSLPATLIGGNCYSSMFSSCTSLRTKVDLQHVKTVNQNGCNQITLNSDNSRPVFGPALEGLAASGIASTDGSHKIEFNFTDNDQVLFNTANIITQGKQKSTYTYDIWTDNTSIKDACLAKKDSYTTVNIYHLDGTIWN